MADPSPANERQVFADIVEQSLLAEELGFDVVWAVEHTALTHYAHMSAPETFLAYLAGRTTRIGLGHGVVCLPPLVGLSGVRCGPDPEPSPETAAARDLRFFPLSCLGAFAVGLPFLARLQGTAAVNARATARRARLPKEQRSSSTKKETMMIRRRGGMLLVPSSRILWVAALSHRCGRPQQRRSKKPRLACLPHPSAAILVSACMTHAAHARSGGRWGSRTSRQDRTSLRKTSRGSSTTTRSSSPTLRLAPTPAAAMRGSTSSIASPT